MKDKNNNPGNLNVWVFLAIILCGFALYIPPLQSTSFYDDDHFSVENNEAVKKIDIPEIFNAFNTRSLVGLSFALNYKFCGLNPAGYRSINLLIHCLNAFLVFLLVKATLYLFSARRPMFSCRLEWPAFFASMLFLCHPIQTDPVNFITQRFVLMGTFFYLLTLYLYIQYRCRKQNRYLITAMGSAIAAMFCKEFTVTLPLMLVLYEFYFLDASAEPWWKRCSRVLPFFVIVLIVPLLLLRTPPKAIGVANIANSDLVQEDNTQKFENHVDITRARYSIGRKPYFLTELNVLCTYVRLLFLPIRQDFDYEYPISYHLDNKTILCGVFLLSLLALAAITYKTYRIVSFGILWFFIALSVESSFIPIGDVIAEYRVYLASVGFVFLVMSLIYTKKMDIRKLNMLAAVILMGFSILTFQRNKIWQNELTLWNDTIHGSPHKARPYNNRGLVYYRRGNIPQAISDYNKAIELNPKYAVAYYDRGLSFYKQGLLAQALSDYSQAIDIKPDYAQAHNNRGTIYAQQGNLDQALSDYSQALAIIPDFAVAYDNRGGVYYKQGKITQALSDYNKAVTIDPKLAEAYVNRGILYSNQGKTSQAISDFTEAIEINPAYGEAYNNRGNNYGHQGNLPQAISDYTKAIELDPALGEAYNNRGTIYGRQGHLSQAIADFTKAIELNPEFAAAYKNRGFAYYYGKEYAKAWADVREAEALGAVVNPDFINKLKQDSGKDQ